ncbi:MAG: T9SS type A sorting domain-containing protein [Flavobacteriia bacterium]|nr:T9SS type A sorting domain-containing protein [Flavobacteriia bacterium]
MKKYVFGLLAVFILCVNQPINAQFKVVGYLPVWSPMYPSGMATIQLDKLTHLNIAFANPNASGTLVPSFGTAQDLQTAVQTGHAHNLKVLLSLGGGADGTNYHNLISTDIPAFVDSIVTYAVANNLDGIDVDIEGDILDGTQLTALQYETFVTQLGSALHAQNKLMTCALGTWFGNYVTSAAASQFDFINVMSYDATGPWDPQNPGQHAPFSMYVSDFQYWNTTKNIPQNQLTMGVPFYGYGFGTYANQGISFCDIVTTYPGSENADQIGNGGDAIYYNGIPTIQQKTTYALQQAGGIMIWELTEDCFGNPSLLSVIDSVINASNLGYFEKESPEIEVGLFPNPVSELLSISFKNTNGRQVLLSIHQLNGETISTHSIQKSDEIYQLDVSDLTNGMYLVKILGEDLTTIRRIVLEK